MPSIGACNFIKNNLTLIVLSSIGILMFKKESQNILLIVGLTICIVRVEKLTT